MTTNHKPATALPWNPDGRFVFEGTSLENARYATHAANAYPRLVEALRDVRRSQEPANDFTEDWWLGWHDLLIAEEFAGNITDETRRRVAERADALLSDLGES